MRTSAPRACASSSEPRLPGTRSMSPKVARITPSVSAIAIASSTRPIGITQTGQPGPCTSSTSGRQQVADPVPVDRVGVPAADLHDPHLLAGHDERRDLGRERAGQLGRAVLVDEPHDAASASTRERDAGVAEQERRRRRASGSGRSRRARCAAVALDHGLVARRRDTARERDRDVTAA